MMRAVIVASVMIVVAAVAMSGRGPSLGQVLTLGTSAGPSPGAPPFSGGVAGVEVAPTPPTEPPATATLPPDPAGLHRWSELPVHYCIDTSQTGVLPNERFGALTDEAFAAWGVPAVDDGACAHPESRGDRVNEIGWGTPPGAPPPGSRVTEAGVTLTTYSRCTANCGDRDPVSIIEADIIITKEVPPEFRSERCVYSTLLHETGHFLGLEHLPAPSVMQAQTSSCMTELTPADLAALIARYGNVASPKPDIFGP